MSAFGRLSQIRKKRWLEPELFRPFIFGVLFCLTLSEFVRGALTLSLLPTYGRTVLGFQVEATALALSVQYLMDTALRPVAGWLADKVGQRVLLIAGFSISTLSLFWMMHVHTLGGLLTSAAFYGLGVTPVWPSAVSGIGIATPENKRGSFMGYLYIFWLAGTGLGPVLINLVIGRTYHMAFWLLIGVSAAGFATAWLLLSKRPANETHLAVNEAQAPRLQRGQAPDASAQSSRWFHQGYWTDLWRNIREVAFLFPGMFVQTFAVSSLIPILSLFAKVKLDLSGATYSLILVAGGAFTVVFLIPAGKLVDRFGPRRFLVPGFLSAGTVLGAYAVYHTLASTFAAMTLLGMSYAFILPAWNFVLDHSIDKDKKGTLWGVFMTVEGTGSVIGPYVGGVLWDKAGATAPFWLSAGVIFGMGLMYMVLPIEQRHSRAGTMAAASHRAVNGMDSRMDKGMGSAMDDGLRMDNALRRLQAKSKRSRQPRLQHSLRDAKFRGSRDLRLKLDRQLGVEFGSDPDKESDNKDTDLRRRARGRRN